MSFLGWCARKGFRPENVFPAALIVHFARFYSAALGGILLIDPEIRKISGLSRKRYRCSSLQNAFLENEVVRIRGYLTVCENFFRALVNLEKLDTLRLLALFRRY